MKNKIITLTILGIFLISLVYAQTIGSGGVSYCCEKTIDGAWCQNSNPENCHDNFRKVPTSCEATSYCRLGCCYDSQEGTCMENTPQKVCQNNEGIWAGESAECDIPQCSLGCCLIGDQAAFVTQTRCKRLSSVYGLEINYRTDIGNEIECIASTISSVKGACVFERDYEKTCTFTTKRECEEIKTTITNATSVEFFAGDLCSSDDPAISNNCGPTKQTKCVEGRDEVYFIDSCGNLANIYDATRYNDKTYWNEIISKAETCGVGSSNANSKACGSCDYYLGSTCKGYKPGQDKSRPTYGDNICRDLSCGEYQHGETWCSNSEGAEDNLPGSRYFRMICYNNEISIEPCADYRNEYCLQDEVNGFRAAGCVVNKWQDCVLQTVKKDCENKDRRDCEWKGGSGEVKCVPEYTPGFDFWNPEGDAGQLCAQATTQCIVEFEKKLGKDKKCEKNCECLEPSWEEEMNEKCISIGDCGVSVNYINVEGYNEGSSVTITKAKDEAEGGGGGLF